MRAIFFICGLLLGGVGLLGCSCDGKEESKKTIQPVDLSKPPPPLVVKDAPRDLGVQVFPQKGATSARPIALVAAQDPSLCATVRKGWESSGHVLCTDAPAEKLESRLRQAVTYLKATYPRHVGKPPVHLFTSPERSDAGWRLMLKEPGFFAYAFLPGLDEKVLTHTTLSALHSRGARELLLGVGESNRLKLLQTVAARRGLQIHPLGPKSSELEGVVARMRERDARFQPPLAPKPAP